MLTYWRAHSERGFPRFQAWMLAPALVALAGCGSPAVGPCQSAPGIEAICGFKNPEDMRLLPDSKTLLISQVGALGRASSGSLVFFDTQSKQISAAFPPSHPSADANFMRGSLPTDSSWGASNCPGPPGAEFSPLGISIQQRQDGRWQVAAVNHGQRMSVEMFEWLQVGAHYRLEWRGCLPTPAEVSMNSVALLRHGGFVASHMFDRTAPSVLGFSTGLWKSQLGIDTGYAFEWQPAQEDVFRVLSDSPGPFLNGIELSADEREVFVSVTSGNQIRKLDRASGKLLATLALERPDNLSWDAQGYVLAASLTGSRLQNLICIQNTGESCGLAFEIVRIDPVDMSSELVFKHEGAPMGAATVAQQVGDFLYLGSFTGDRILKIPYARKKKTPSADLKQR